MVNPAGRFRRTWWLREDMVGSLGESVHTDPVASLIDGRADNGVRIVG
ncbi:MAG: hypothetical protein H5T78_14845 [Nocardia sp.]|nr:hypothetical protein [Nocardia sp.]